MAVYPTYDFNDPDLNYSDVYATVVLMYSDLNAQMGCCPPKGVQDTFYKVDVQLANIPFDLANNEERWKEDVKSAYLLLYPIAS